MDGELFVSGPPEGPAYLSDDSIEQKANTILKWIEHNYARASEQDVGYLFEDFENEYELAEELEDDHDQSTSELVKHSWGRYLSVDELEKIVALIDKENTENWLPEDHLIHVDEIEEDELETLEELQNRIPALVSSISELTEIIPFGIGHNGAPSSLTITRESIEELATALNEFAALEGNDVQDQSSWLIWLVELANNVASALARYADSFVSNAAAEAGKEFGKWGVRASALILTSGAIKSFAEGVIQLLGN